ncbi:hypothetical protein EYF80_038000 [Liparis tanakae]|uniref:Uncharacterized protein n=1 Tax=Liparis tanakae TaxID=230148 RepID=A0A4Z2GGH7_9TELE|nr:hypothetical protein EYF80_038000 [Liparis tanakae]
MLSVLKAAAGPPISDRVLLVGAGGMTGRCVAPGSSYLTSLWWFGCTGGTREPVMTQGAPAAGRELEAQAAWSGVEGSGLLWSLESWPTREGRSGGGGGGSSLRAGGRGRGLSRCVAAICGGGQPAHDQVILQAVVVFLVIAGSFCSAGTLKTSKGGPTGLRVERVHHDGLRAFDLTAAKRAALTLRLLIRRQEAPFNI